jgi:hypothetical protein
LTTTRTSSPAPTPITPETPEGWRKSELIALLPAQDPPDESAEEDEQSPEVDADAPAWWSLEFTQADGDRCTLPGLLCTPSEIETLRSQLQYSIDHMMARHGQGEAEVPETLRELEEGLEIEEE